METSQLICYANQLTGLYMRAILAFDQNTVEKIIEKYGNHPSVNAAIKNL